MKHAPNLLTLLVVVALGSLATAMHGCASEPIDSSEKFSDPLKQCADVLPHLGMPFSYELPDQPGDSYIQVESINGLKKNLIFGPWGAHASGHTGHINGNAKADMAMLSVSDYSEMTYFHDAGADPEACTEENFTTSGVFRCGLHKSKLYAERFAYTAQSSDYQIVSIIKELEIVDHSYYVFGEYQWRVAMHVEGKNDCFLGVDLVHLEALGPKLIADLENRGVNLQSAPIGENLISFYDPVMLSEGDVIAYAQIIGGTGHPSLKDHPDLDIANYVFPHIMAQIEFTTGLNYRNHASGEWELYSLPVYAGLDAAEYEMWSDIFNHNIKDPGNPRYGLQGSQWNAWLWASEGVLMLNHGFTANDASSLVSELGTWWEGHPNCLTQPSFCDEVVGFFPIHRDSVVFAEYAAFYHPDSNYMFSYMKNDEHKTTGFWEIVAIYDRTGGSQKLITSLDNTFEGVLLARPRVESVAPGTLPEETILGYQVIGYNLDPSAAKLVLSWGTLRATQNEALADIGEPPSQDAPCTGSSAGDNSTTCHYKMNKEGYVKFF